jgi:hypothetical protein
MLDQLISTYGPDAVLSVIPDLLEDGELVGWIVEVDGVAADGLAVHQVEDADADLRVLMLAQGSQQLELERRPLEAERTGYVDTLRAVQKRLAASA